MQGLLLSEKLFELKRIILDFTGAKDVIFDWETEYNERLKNGDIDIIIGTHALFYEEDEKRILVY